MASTAGDENNSGSSRSSTVDREALRGEGERVLDIISTTCVPTEWAALLRGPLVHAVTQGDERLSKKLIRAGAEIGTSVHAAVRGGNRELVDLMLDNGGSPHTKDARGNTPLHFAANSDQLEIARLLLLKGAKKDAIGFSGKTPLHIAAGRGSVALVETLLIAGADLTRRAKPKGTTPLECAVAGGHLDVVKLLIYAGADVNAAAPRSRRTTLHVASTKHNAAMIDTLMEAGANTEARDFQGTAPLHLAAGRLNVDAARSLLKHGATVNAQTRTGYTPLHFAAGFTREEEAAAMVDLLLRSGSDETITTSDGQTAEDFLETPRTPELRLADRIERVRRLLANAPADRAWRRRGLLLLCRAHPRRVRLGCSWASLVVRVAELGEEDVFRKIVGYL